MGIVGAGNSGSLMATLFAPRLAERSAGRPRSASRCIPVVCVAIVFALAREGQPGPASRPSWRDYSAFCASPTRSGSRFFYSLTFGGFVGFTSFLTTFFHEQYHVSRVSAGDFTTMVVVSGSLMRPLGGWLSDRLGGYRLLLLLLAGARWASAPWPTLPPLASSFRCCLYGRLLGMGNGAVFQLVPQRFAGRMGIITGIVGAAGGLGGFFLPSMLGAAKDATGTYAMACSFFAAAFLVGSLVLLELGTRWTVRWQPHAVQRSGIFSYRERVRCALRAYDTYGPQRHKKFSPKLLLLLSVSCKIQYDEVAVSSLKGARVAVLEARMSVELAAMVERFGGVPYSVPAVRETPLEQPEDVSAFVDALCDGRFAIVVLMTGVGVAACCARPNGWGAWTPPRRTAKHDHRVPRSETRRGAASARRPDQHHGCRAAHDEELLQALEPVAVEGKTVGFLHYGERNETAADGLRARGAAVSEVCLYEWRLLDDVTAFQRLVGEIIDGRIDAIVITSQIQCRHLFQVADGSASPRTDRGPQRPSGRRGRRSRVRHRAASGGRDPPRPTRPSQDGPDDDRARRLLRTHPSQGPIGPRGPPVRESTRSTECTETNVSVPFFSRHNWRVLREGRAARSQKSHGISRAAALRACHPSGVPIAPFASMAKFLAVGTFALAIAGLPVSAVLAQQPRLNLGRRRRTRRRCPVPSRLPCRSPTGSTSWTPKWLTVRGEFRDCMEGGTNIVVHARRLVNIDWLNRFRFDVSVKPSQRFAVLVQAQGGARCGELRWLDDGAVQEPLRPAAGLR